MTEAVWATSSRGAEPIEACHQQIPQGRRDLARGHGGARGFQQRAHQLLHEQGHAIGARHQRLDQRLRRHEPRREACDHLAHVPLVEPAECQLGVVRLHRPGGSELRPPGTEQEKRLRRALLGNQPQQRQRRGVDPVQVLRDDDRRLHPRRKDRPGDYRRQQLLALLLGRQQRRREPLRRQRQAQQGCDQRYGVGGFESRQLQRRGQRVEPRVRRLLTPPGKGLPEEVADDVKWTMLVIRGAGALEPAVRRAGYLCAELLYQARLADAGLADDEHDLALAVLRQLPAVHQQAALLLAARERRQTACRRDGQPAAYPARPHDAIERHRLAHALEHLRASVLDDEYPGHDPLRRRRDDDRVGRGRALYPCRDVRRLAEDLAAIGDHHRSRVHADPHR